MFDVAPNFMVAVPTFGDEAMDMGIPFEIPAEGVENHDKAWCKVLRLIQVEKHSGDNACSGMEEAV